ncbi:MAG: type II toxin-antitoxin system HicB family antitoxin [bacterium]
MKEKISSWIQESSEKALKFEKNAINLSVHVLIEQEEDLYTAHCLEFDIVADGKTIEEVEKNILDAIVSHVGFCVAYNNIDKILNPAPQEFWTKFYFGSEKLREYTFPEDYSKEDINLSSVQKFIKDVNFSKSQSHVYA